MEIQALCLRTIDFLNTHQKNIRNLLQVDDQRSHRLPPVFPGDVRPNSNVR